MLDDSFWSVEVGIGMGPLVLGKSKSEIIHVLHRTLEGEVGKTQIEDEIEEEDNEVYAEVIETNLSFSKDSLQNLKRIDVEDDRVRFGPMKVLGKPIHEIVNLFNVPTSETLWCDFFEEDEQATVTKKKLKRKNDRELLYSNTLWITSLGLGLTVDRAKILSVHLCHPDDAPRYGSGTWNDKQRALSQTGFPTRPIRDSANPTKEPLLIRLAVLGVILAVGVVIWKAVILQQAWSRQPDTPAKIVAKDPPPPEPFPDFYHVTYIDKAGVEHEATFRALDVYGVPDVGTDINIRFLPDAPDKPMTAAQYDDIGFGYAIPRCIAIGVVFVVIKLLSGLWLLFRK